MKPRIYKLATIKISKHIDAFLITSSTSVKYLCGYFYNFEIGASPFQVIPAVLFVDSSEKTCLLIADNETDQLSEIDTHITICQYTSYSYNKPLNFSTDFHLKLIDLCKNLGSGKIRIGIEPNSLPQSIANSVYNHYPNVEFTDITNDLSGLRIIKDDDEIECIRASTHLCDIGQEAVFKYAKPGISELELFTLVRGDMDLTAGKRVPMMADLVCGARTFDGGGNPSANVIKSGDLVLSDLTPCLNGYWGDTCNTMVVGKPTLQQTEHFKLVQETLQIAISAIRPGIHANTIDQLMRKNLASAGGFGHHGGHGVGIHYHEEPRIVPYNEMKLQPNMVISIEPGIYTNGYGIRLEHIVVVTQTGCEVLSKFIHRL